MMREEPAEQRVVIDPLSDDYTVDESVDIIAPPLDHIEIRPPYLLTVTQMDELARRIAVVVESYYNEIINLYGAPPRR